MKMGAMRTADIVKGLRNLTRTDTQKSVKYNIHEGLEDSLKILNNMLKNKIIVVKNYGEDVNEISCYPSQLS